MLIGSVAMEENQQWFSGADLLRLGPYNDWSRKYWGICHGFHCYSYPPVTTYGGVA